MPTYNVSVNFVIEAADGTAAHDAVVAAIDSAVNDSAIESYGVEEVYDADPSGLAVDDVDICVDCRDAASVNTCPDCGDPIPLGIECPRAECRAERANAARTGG